MPDPGDPGVLAGALDPASRGRDRFESRVRVVLFEPVATLRERLRVAGDDLELRSLRERACRIGVTISRVTETS